MHGVLYALGVGGFVMGAGVLGLSKSVLHEQLAAHAFVAGAIFFSSGSIVEVLQRILRAIEPDED